MDLIATTTPELGSVSIRLPFNGRGGLEFRYFLSYEYNQHFLTPADAWSFSIAGDQLSDQDRADIVPGARVDVTVDGLVQSVGYISRIRTRSSHGGGTVITIEGRDWLARAVDAHVDPQLRFTPTMSLLDLLTAVFTPFGVQVLAIDNDANRNVITGSTRGTKTSKKGKPLKSVILHRTQPLPQEGAFAFASRVSQRHGLWLWPAADGVTLICGQPDFDQTPIYALRHKADPSSSLGNNVLEADVEASNEEQPSIIFASGSGGGGEFARATLRGGIVNPLVLTSNQSVLTAYPDVQFTTPPVSAIGSAILTVPVFDPNACPLYLHDPESQTIEQLFAFLRRELSLRMRKSLTARYTIEGHKLGGQPIAVNTMIDIDDDRSNVRIPLWVIGRTFRKHAGSSGTTTTIECIRPGTLIF